jgi:hypothetical protein
MGFFDRFASKKPEAAPAQPNGLTESPAPASGGGVIPRLAAAREKLEAQDLPGALAIYEEVLASSGDRADVLVTVSGDLGSNGHVAQIVELVAPRYDADRHGPATGLNLLQAYLALRQAEAAQHVLDILFALNRADLEDRLHGFSNAIADLIAQDVPPVSMASGGPAEAPKVALITISKPIWFYGLEPLAAEILPEKSGPLRRIAFAPLAVPGAARDPAAAMKLPEDELGRLSRAVPLWFAETFYFSTLYAPVAVVGVVDHPSAGKSYMVFSAEWTQENIRQLVASNEEGFDYVVTGALQEKAGDYELLLRVWEVKKFRERKQFAARWTPATAEAELAKLHAQVRAYMEWAPATAKATYAPPAAPRLWLDALGASLSLFLLGKKLLTVEQMPAMGPALDAFAPEAAANAITSLAWLTLVRRAQEHGLAPAMREVQLSFNPLVAKAREILG